VTGAFTSLSDVDNDVTKLMLNYRIKSTKQNEYKLNDMLPKLAYKLKSALRHVRFINAGEAMLEDDQFKKLNQLDFNKEKLRRIDISIKSANTRLNEVSKAADTLRRRIWLIELRQHINEMKKEREYAVQIIKPVKKEGFESEPDSDDQVPEDPQHTKQLILLVLLFALIFILIQRRATEETTNKSLSNSLLSTTE
jgi:hypothetical protein